MEIKLKNVNYTYHLNSPQQFTALKNVNLSFPEHQFTAVIGKTGSGKSTLIKLLNGLELPTNGEVVIGNQIVDSYTKSRQLTEIRKNVGMVFQFSEHQLFAETIIKDVMFGPMNFGKSEAEAFDLAQTWLAKVGIEPALFNQSPFELSGGQMRRVALAGVLACNPKVLVLDEPGAGLDPISNQNLMTLLKELQIKKRMTIIMVTHSMNDVAAYADYAIVMKNGTVIEMDTPLKLFSAPKPVVELPEAACFYREVMKNHHFSNQLPLTKAELIKQLLKQFKINGGAKHE